MSTQQVLVRGISCLFSLKNVNSNTEASPQCVRQAHKVAGNQKVRGETEGCFKSFGMFSNCPGSLNDFKLFILKFQRYLQAFWSIVHHILDWGLSMYKQPISVLVSEVRDNNPFAYSPFVIIESLSLYVHPYSLTLAVTTYGFDSRF